MPEQPPASNAPSLSEEEEYRQLRRAAVHVEDTVSDVMQDRANRYFRLAESILHDARRISQRVEGYDP